MQTDFDIVIAGGGMVGASLALALGESELKIAVVEPQAINKQTHASYDDRGLALSLSSRRIFEALGLWQALASNANPIRRVHVSDKGHFGKVRMDAASMGLDSLGHVVIARELGTTLIARLQKLHNVEFLCPARVTQMQQQDDRVVLGLMSAGTVRETSCKLLVVADGTHSQIRAQLGIPATQLDYRQSAIVSNITSQFSHADTAYERFTPSGPLAFLPLPENRGVMVCCVPSDEAEHYLGLGEEEYLGQLQRRFGRRLGTLGRLGKRQAYPIIQLQVEQQHVHRAVLLGNSAHTIHPNGAQGFNLCLRDVAGLAEQLIASHTNAMDIGSKPVLDAYVLSRLHDQRRVSAYSHKLADWFYNRQVIKSLVRNMAMTALDLSDLAKFDLMRRGMGVSAKQPSMVRGQAV